MAKVVYNFHFHVHLILECVDQRPNMLPEFVHSHDINIILNLQGTLIYRNSNILKRNI